MLEDVSTDSASISTSATPSGGIGGELRHPPSYSAEEYICRQAPKIDARPLAIKPTRELFTMRTVLEEREKAFAGWFTKCNRWAGRRGPTVVTNPDFMNMAYLVDDAAARRWSIPRVYSP